MNLTEENLKAFCDSIATYSSEHKEWAEYLMENLCRPGEIRAKYLGDKAGSANYYDRLVEAR